MVQLKAKKNGWSLGKDQPEIILKYKFEYCMNQKLFIAWQKTAYCTFHQPGF